MAQALKEDATALGARLFRKKANPGAPVNPAHYWSST